MTNIQQMPSRIYFGSEPSRPTAPSEPWFLDPREIMRALRPRWPLVAIPTALFGLAGLAWIALVPPQFAASTQILIDPRGIQVVKDGVTPSDQASDASLLLVDSQARVLTSDDVLRRVVDRFHLDRDQEFVKPPTLVDTLKSWASTMLGGSGTPAEDDKLIALRTLRERSSAKRLERSFVVELGVTTESRQKSADLSQALAETYLSAASEAQAQVTRKGGAALTGRLGELQDQLRKAEDAAQQYRASNNLVGTRAQLVSEQALTQLNQQLGAARARATELRGRLSQIDGVIGGKVDLNSVNEIVQSSTITQLRGQLAQIEAARADTVANLGPRHPTLQTSQLQVQNLRGQIDSEIKRIAAALRNDYKAAAANETSLAATLETRKKEALSVDKSFVRLRELDRQVEAARTVYETFLVRARELEEQQRIDTSTSRIISPASPPAKRLGPPAVAVLAAALAAGLGVGVSLALLAVPATGRIGSRRRLEHVAGIPVTAVLPAQPLALRRGDTPVAEPDHRVAVARLGSRLQRELGSLHPAIVLVTSADDRAGKTALARSLAVSAAYDGQRVLLVDGDPEAVISRDLPGRASRGPGEMLRLRQEFTEALVELPSGVKVLPYDERTMRLGTTSFSGVILEASESFDTVFVDIGLVGTDVAAERFAQDPRFPALLLTVSAIHSSVLPLQRALDAIGREARLRLVLTDAKAAD